MRLRRPRIVASAIDLLQKGDLQCVLEGGDGTFSVWEGGFEMIDDLCGGRAWGRVGRWIGRRTSCEERGANVALCQFEASDDAL